MHSAKLKYLLVKISLAPTDFISYNPKLCHAIAQCKLMIGIVIL